LRRSRGLGRPVRGLLRGRRGRVVHWCGFLRGLGGSGGLLGRGGGTSARRFLPGAVIGCGGPLGALIGPRRLLGGLVVRGGGGAGTGPRRGLLGRGAAGAPRVGRGEVLRPTGIDTRRVLLPLLAERVHEPLIGTELRG